MPFSTSKPRHAKPARERRADRLEDTAYAAGHRPRDTYTGRHATTDRGATRAA